MSKRYSKKTVKYYSSKRRAIMAQGEEINHTEIFERDGWVCQLCFAPVDKRVRYPAWQSATLDHIIPLSRGGGHEKSNTQLAHRRCNELKGADFEPETHLTFVPRMEIAQ